MLQELKFIFEKQAGVERFDLVQTFYACKQEEGKSVSSYVLEMRSYMEQLELFSYVLSQDISVGLILNGLNSDFADFVNGLPKKAKGKGKGKIGLPKKGKTIGELHTLLIEYENGLPKKASRPQVLGIQGDRIQKPNKKPNQLKGRVKKKKGRIN
nr:hypothetical protein [Tanacetum cinerariifolium]